jgi:hypothetical protein
MSKTCSEDGKTRNTYKILVVMREKKRPLGDLNVNSRIILKLMLKRVSEYVLDSSRSG